MIESQIYLACLLGLSRYRLHGEKRLSCRNCSKLSCLNLDCIGEIVVIYLIPIGEIKISIHRFHFTAFPFPFSSQISACISLISTTTVVEEKHKRSKGYWDRTQGITRLSRATYFNLPNGLVRDSLRLGLGTHSPITGSFTISEKAQKAYIKYDLNSL